MIRMPWTDRTAPNLSIEVADACNVTCRACYRRTEGGLRSPERIRGDLDDALRLRPLHTVTITGGEPTLHPDLCRIVGMVHERGLHVFLCTNGVLVEAGILRDLRRAGLDSILFHVDTGQVRPDLPAGASFGAVRTRLEELGAMAAAEGIDASFSAMLDEVSDGPLAAYTGFFLASDVYTFMFLSRAMDLGAFYARPEQRIGEGGVDAVTGFLRRAYGIEPFAVIPASDSGAVVWASYFVPVVCNGSRRRIFRYRSNALDAWTMRWPRLVGGRYIHKTVQQPRLTMARVAMNALSTLRWGEGKRFMREGRRPGATVRHKMIVYDDGPHAGAGGEIVRCEYCPTAIVRNGRAVACCAADYGTGCGGPP